MISARSATLTAVILVLVSSTGAAVLPASAAQPNVQITNVTTTPNEPTTGESVTVETTISNLEGSDGTAEITTIYLRTAGDAETHERIRDVGSVSPGGSVTIPLSTSFDSAGEKELTAHVTVRGENGRHHSYEYPVYVDVSEPNVRADLLATAGNDSSTTDVELTNYGNTNLTDVEIAASANGDVFDRNYLFDADPETSQSTVFDTENVSDETVTFTASYRADGENRTLTDTVDLSDDDVPGEIRLTGIETTRTGTGLTINGEAANIGGTDTESLLVSVPNGENVSPTAPSGEYFVGAVDSSEFATFELTADVESDVSSIPVELAYIEDGDRVTTTQQVDITSTNASVAGGGEQAAVENGERGPGNAGGPSGLPMMEIGTALAVILLGGVGLVAYRWRQS